MKRLLVCFVLLLPLALHAQRIPVDTKFGKISDAELDMTVYDADTSAAAVVLLSEDEVTLSVDLDLRMRMVHKTHERIKILKESGRDYADYRLYFRTDNDLGEAVTGIKVSTFNREGKKMVETKMDKKYVFTEPYRDGVKSVSFSPQNVKVGSVIEVTFQQVSNVFYDVPNVFLQRSVPVNLATASYSFPDFFYVRKMTRGSEDIEYTNTESPAIVAGFQFNNKIDNYKLTDAPGLRAESLSYNPDQYKAAVYYVVSQMQIPGNAPRNFSYTWDQIDKMIRDTEIWTETRAKCRFREEVDALKNQFQDEKALIAAVRDLVLSKVEWDGTRALIPQKNAETLKKRTGSAADINALTGSALQEAGFEVFPLMVRRRSSGYVPDFYISVDAFDLFILSVTGPSGTTFYLDAAPKEGYVNVLSDDFLITNARVIRPENLRGDWVDISALGSNQLVVNCEMRLAPDGLVTGKMTGQATNEQSYALKKSYGSYKDKDEFISQEELSEGVEIVSLSVDGMDVFSSSAVLNEEFERSYDIASGRIYLDPFATTFHDRAQFRDETRQVAMDFPFKKRITYQARISIPEGFTVEELPQNAAFALDPLKIRVQFSCSQPSPDQIVVSYLFQQNAVFAVAEDYPAVRAFWEQLCNIYDKTIVLKKL